MKSIIQKWYSRLGFPHEYDAEFYKALENTSLDSDSVKKSWEEIADPVEILLAYLYRCEALSKKYEQLGIDEDILLDTLSDIVIWTKTYHSIHEKLGIAEPGWVSRHMEAGIFKLGRLQFSPANAWCDVPEANIYKGDPVLEIHIPAGEALTPEACRDSIVRAELFFGKYFPDHDWKRFTCYSWLLDSTLLNFISESSNIAKFRNLFTITSKNEVSDAALKYVFRRDTTRENLANREAVTTLAKKLKAHVLAGGTLYTVFGFIPRQN